MQFAGCLTGGGFNPRTRTGCDYCWQRFCLDVFQFQSTHPYGVRLCPLRHWQIALEFQSTHPYGVRPAKAIAGFLWLISFNPRTRTGCDIGYSQLNHSGIVFQSTHPYGVRQKYLVTFNVFQIVSIHAPVRGATRAMGIQRR